jgi:hypothetical protein
MMPYKPGPVSHLPRGGYNLKEMLPSSGNALGDTWVVRDTPRVWIYTLGAGSGGLDWSVIVCVNIRRPQLVKIDDIEEIEPLSPPGSSARLGHVECTLASLLVRAG